MASNQMGLLANVLHRMKLLEENQSRHVAVLHKVKLDLQDVAKHVKELEFSQKCALKEVHSSLQTFGEQMATDRRKEQEKARLAFLHLRQEMEEERETCRLLKLQNKKLASDLVNADVAAADACEELGRERKARELLEEVCNELAKEIGEDKAEVEHLKQEQEKSRKRLEQELKMIKMDALWQDERVEDNASESKIGLYEGNGKQCTSLNELRSKIQAFVEAAEVCTHKGTQEQMEKQHPFRECEDRNEEVGSPARHVGGAVCSNTRSSSQQSTSNITENTRNRDDGGYMRNKDDGNHRVHGETEILHEVEHKVSNYGKRRPSKLRQLMQARRQQKRNGRMADHKSFHVWASRGNSGWASSEDEPDQRQLVTSEIVHNNDLQHGEKQPELSKSTDCIMIKEYIRPEQSLHIPISAESHKKHLVPSQFGSEGQAELCGKLEAHLSSNMLYSLSEDDTTRCVMRVDERRGNQESALHAQGEHAVIKGQELRSFSDIRDKRNHVYHHNDNLDMHRSTGGSWMGCADTKLNHTSFQPVIRTSDTTIDGKLNHEVDGYHDSEVNIARLAKTRSNCDDEACCGKANSFCQGCKDFEKVHRNVQNITLPTSQMLDKIKLQGTAYSGDNQTMKKLSPWRPTSVKSPPLLHFWSPTSDATKCSIKACTLSPTNSQDKERRTANSSGMHLRGDTLMEGTIAQNLANQQPLPCLKGNSLGVQLVKARELENEQKPAKPSFRFSPLRRAVSYG